MQHNQPAGAAGRRTRSTVLAVLVLAAALMGVVGCDSKSGSTLTAAPPMIAESSAHRWHELLVGDAPADLPGRLQGSRQGALGVADGEVPDGVTLFDEQYPAVTKLDPAFLRALRSAAAAAADQGVEIDVHSGWRSEKYQEQLFEQAVAKYGSEARAAQWVARPGTSIHETGGAVDVGPEDAATWLSENGAQYGLCQTYRNEPWHFELRRKAVNHGCPRMYADPADDPRMHQ